jgi:[protein-PII] uridylyltransferase
VSSFGPTFTWNRAEADLHLALAGKLALRARLADRARTYGGRRKPAHEEVEPEVHFDLGASADATVVEVHASDSLGVLYRITTALADLDLDITGAKVQTLGSRVVDSFFVRSTDGAKPCDPDLLVEVERALLHALSAPA